MELLEVNNSSLTKVDKRLNCVQNYKTMLQYCMEYQVPVIVNTDAHDPNWVGRFQKAEALLKETEFDENLILNTELEKIRSFLLR